MPGDVMDGSMRPGSASRPSLRLAHGSQDQTRAESPQKGGVQRRPRRGIRVCLSNPGRLLVNKTPRFAQQPKPSDRIFTDICLRERSCQPLDAYKFTQMYAKCGTRRRRLRC